MDGKTMTSKDGETPWLRFVAPSSKDPSLKIVHHLRNLDDSQTKWKYLAGRFGKDGCYTNSDPVGPRSNLAQLLE